MYFLEFDEYVVIHNLLYYIKFGWVSATPYCNYSLLCILLSEVFSSTIWTLVEYKLVFPVASLCFILTILYYINYDVHEVLLKKLSVVEYNYGYCKKNWGLTDCIIYHLVRNIFCEILPIKLNVAEY